MSSKIIEILMNRDGLTRQQAKEVLEEMRFRIYMEGGDPETELHDIGLEPDYIFELI